MRIRAALGAILVMAFFAQEPPRGEIVADVRCAADPSQSYALYLPTRYTPDRAWPVVLAFDPGARGRVPVERYQAAAEQYGYIVAGSNNSRNNSTETGRAAVAMSTDVSARFRIDPARVYAAGMSGGARVAFSVALSSRGIAGVIASSAGYPDGQMRKKLAFPVFATAGTEDFNHLEMRMLDRELSTPHYLAIFEGGHTWLSSDLAVEAVEWMEIAAMKAGVTPRHDATIDRILAKRVKSADTRATPKDGYLALQAIVTDFTGLRDVSALATRATALGKEKSVRDALRHDRDEDTREERVLVDIKTLESQLTYDDRRAGALMQLRQQWESLARATRAADDTADRRFARRVIGALSSGVTTTDADYLKIINEFRTGRGR